MTPPVALAALICLGLGLSATPARAQDIPPPALPLAVAAYSPIPIDFGFISVRQTPPQTVVSVRNLGSADLVITSITTSHPAFTVDAASLPPLGPGESATFRVAFQPTAPGPDADAIVIESNDAFNPTFKLPIQGEGVDIAVAVAPDRQLLVPSQSIQFTATLTGSPSPAVTWSVEGDGTISATGRYTAPATTGGAVIRATSVIDPVTSGTASVVVITPDVTASAAASLGAGHLGARVETADFDGDGLVEAVVGAPQADAAGGGGTVAGAGAVWIRTFGYEAFEGVPQILNSPTPVAGGGFGTAIEVGDFNGDGRVDLAVGEPGGTGIGPGTGALHFFFGDGAGGFDPAVTAAPADGTAGDGFGTSLAAGFFGGGSIRQLAVGAPGRAADGQAGAGALYVVDAASGTPTFPLVAPLTAPVPQAGAGLGATLRVACLDGCTRYGLSSEARQFNDLVAGAPTAAVTVGGTPLAGAGRVFAFLSVADATPLAFDPGVEVFSPAPAADAAFGTGLATGDLTGDALTDFAVGAPGQTVLSGGTPLNGGTVFVFVTDGAGGFLPTSHLAAPDPVTDGQFGAALRIADLNQDGILDVAVGAPGTSVAGSVSAFYGTGHGDFDALRTFRAAVPAPGDGYGAALAWRDLNADGTPDLLAGAPAGAAGGGADAGEVDIHLTRPADPLGIAPQRHMLARTGGRYDTLQFVGSVPPEQAVWRVMGDGGTINADGLFTARASTPDRLSDAVTVMLQDPSDAGHWALARVLLVDRATKITNPELLTGADGALLLGLPLAGAHFGTSVTVAHLGRSLTDPFRGLPSVLSAFPSVDSSIVPRLPRYPAYDDPTAPFSSIQFYFGRAEDARTNWGAQFATGDFNGDGIQDLAVSAPLAPSDDGTEVQVGFVDIYLLDDQGAPAASVIRITPSRAMLGPDGSPLWAGPTARSNVRFGTRLLATDLNKDGRADLIVGMPHADYEGLRDAGLAEVLLAPASGDWTQGPIRATLAEPTPREGGYFGSALAVGDLTGDANPELFVGAPGRDPEGLEILLKREGLVHGFAPTFWSQATGEALRVALNGAPHIAIVDPAPPPTGYYNGFGLALTMGNFVGDDAADELAIGVPFQVQVDPALRDYQGVPRKHETGAVDLYDADGGFAVRLLAQVLPPMRQSGMQFGQAIAAGHLGGPDPGGPMFLAVTAPFFDTVQGANTGAVFVYEPAPDGRPRYRVMVTAPDEATADQFGHSIAVGDVNNDGADELVVGAPNATISTLTGYLIYPGRFGGREAVIDTREQAGKVYVIFPGLP